MEEIIKYNGEKANRENCRKIKGKFYEIDKDCFLVDGKWNRVNNGLIVKDYNTGTWHNAKRINEDSTHLYGIVDIINGKPLLGYFSPNSNTAKMRCEINPSYTEDNINVKVYDGSGNLLECKKADNAKYKGSILGNEIPIISETIAEKLGNVQGLSSEVYFPKISKFNSFFKKNLGPGYGSLNYNSDKSISKYKSEFNKNYSPKIPYNNFRRYANLLGETSFGLEFETCNGFIPKKTLYSLGLIPLRDGSLRRPDGKEPYEYATIPLQGYKGVAALHDSINALNRHCEIDITCSLHVHFGNVPVTKAFTVALMRVAELVQDDLFTMFPAYKSSNNGTKNKDYCKKFTSNEFSISKLKKSKVSKEELENYLTFNFNQIFNFAACGHDVGRQFNVVSASHPINQAKWHIESRYYWLNVVPLLFKNSRTVEFRLHTPTLNRAKVFNWMLICNAMIKYAERNQMEIFRRATKISIEDIIDKAYSQFPQGNNVATHLKEYVRSRKAEFKSYTEKGDNIGRPDMVNDPDYMFESSVGISDIELDL